MEVLACSVNINIYVYMWNWIYNNMHIPDDIQPVDICAHLEG